MAAHFCAPFSFVAETTGKFLFPADRPSPIFTAFSCLLNAIGVIWSVVVSSNTACSDNTKTWLVLGIVIAICNILFAIYIYYRFSRRVTEGGVEPSQAACQLFLYDWGVCVYLICVILLFAWLIVASQKSQAASANDPCGAQLDNMVIIFVLYMVIGAVMVALSLLTECCRVPTWQRNMRSQDPTPARPPPTYPSGLFRKLFMSHLTGAAAPRPSVPSYYQGPTTQGPSVSPQPLYEEAPSVAVCMPPPVNPNYRV